MAESFNTHVMAVKAHRPSQRPLLVICGYLPASDDELNQHIASTVLQGSGTTREDFVFMADWNRTPNQQPFCNLLAGGLVYAMDSDPFFETKGTHRREDGTYTGRLLDFGLSSAGLAVDGRAQHLGPADHDLVTYDVGLQSGRRCWRWQPQRALDANAQVDWDSCWAPVGRALLGFPWRRGHGLSLATPLLRGGAGAGGGGRQTGSVEGRAGQACEGGGSQRQGA